MKLYTIKNKRYDDKEVHVLWEESGIEYNDKNDNFYKKNVKMTLKEVRIIFY